MTVVMRLFLVLLVTASALAQVPAPDPHGVVRIEHHAVLGEQLRARG